MHKKLTKTAAFIALFAFLFLLAPALSNAYRKPAKFDIRLLVKKPAMWISSFWNIITPIFDGGNDASRVIAPDDSTAKIKPLTESASPKPSKGD